MDLSTLRSWLTENRLVRALYFDVLVALARRSPLPSRILGPVKRVLPSVKEWVAEGTGRGSVEISEPAREIVYPPPELCVPEMPPHLARHSHQLVPEVFLARIRRGRIASRTFDVISPDDGLFADFWFGSPGERIHAKSLRALRMPRLRHRDGRFATFATHRASNYYHWINDCLGRLRVLEEAGEAGGFRLIVPARLQRFQRESLELLGFEDRDLAPFDGGYWSVGELLAPSLVSAPQHSSPASCRWLRRRLVPPALRQARGGARRIYVSRAKAGKRRVLGEEEMVRYLEGRGFRTVRTEELSLAEQIALAHSAEVLVAPHGAGLANVNFMQEGATVIELLPAGRAKPCFLSLARAVGLRYACVTDAVEGDEESYVWHRDVDFSVPLDRVAAAVDWACGPAVA